jgi:hypothetical protein
VYEDVQTEESPSGNQVTTEKRTTVLVVGAGGYFGRMAVEELLRFTDCNVVLGGRSRARLTTVRDRIGPAGSRRLSIHPLDLRRAASFASVLDEVRIAVCAAGPFQGLPLTLPQLCIERGVHYVDLADDRGYVRAVHNLVAGRGEAAGLPAVCSGWSAVPALSGVMARLAVDGMDRIDRIDIQIAPGNRMPRSAGTVTSLLSSAGRPLRVWREGAWQTVRGWSEPRPFDFPPPVGRRTGYLVDAPDHDIFPDLFGADRVEFRAGSELGLLNHSLSLLAWLVAGGAIVDVARYGPVLTRGLSLLGFIGHDHGAVGVEARGVHDGRPVNRRVTIVARRAGQRIPVMPAVIMTGALASGALLHGLVPVDRWLSPGQLATECRKRGYRLNVETSKA